MNTPKITWGELENLTWEDVERYTWGGLEELDPDSLKMTIVETITEQIVTPSMVMVGSTVASVDTVQSVSGAKVIIGSTVMQSTSQMIVNIIVSDRDFYALMMDYLPLYERTSDVFQNILLSYDREFRRVEQDTLTVERNMFIDTTVEALRIHERDLNIATNHKLGYDQRRDQIMARYFSSFEQTTIETVLSLAQAYTGGEVSYKFDDELGELKLIFHDKGVPENIEGLRDALDMILPAHIGWSYTHKMTTWGELEPLTWGDLDHLTWEELSVWNEV